MQSVLTTANSVKGGASEDLSEPSTAGYEGERITVHSPSEPYVQQQEQELLQQQQQLLQQQLQQQQQLLQQERDTLAPKTPPSSSHASTGTATTFMKTSHPLVERTSWKRHAASLKENVDKIRSKTVQPLQTSWNSLTQSQGHASTGTSTNADRYMSAIGPAIVALFSSKKEGQLSFLTVYALALLGSSVGFHLFLYFISIGYALGIALPLAVALYKYVAVTTVQTRSLVVAAHTALVLAWAARSVVFFLWREHVNWPALHEKIVQVNSGIKAPSVSVKILCWLVYSFLYVCMLSPCWFRLERGINAATSSSSMRFMWVALALQTTGFLLETVADFQKSTFKASQPARRYEWCHTGVWKYSTHPNYAGEWLFWLGTVIGGLTAVTHPVQAIIMAVGFLFITTVLRGAVQSLGSKHWEKYGNNPEFLEFQRRYGVMGPKLSVFLSSAMMVLRSKRGEAQPIITAFQPDGQAFVQDEDFEASPHGTNL